MIFWVCACVCVFERKKKLLLSDPDKRPEGFHHFILIMSFTAAASYNYTDFIFVVNDLDLDCLHEIRGNSLSHMPA